MQLSAKFWSLDGDDAQTVVDMARAHPEDFVLKPQREGGGNNYFGEQIIDILKNFETDPNIREIAKSLTLMQRIKPPAINTILMKNGGIESVPTVSELGVYGFILSSSEGIQTNKTSGYLLRTKHLTTNEGGIAAGFAFLDTPYLI